jgi:hypothetical protein
VDPLPELLEEPDVPVLPVVPEADEPWLPLGGVLVELPVEPFDPVPVDDPVLAVEPVEPVADDPVLPADPDPV